MTTPDVDGLLALQDIDTAADVLHHRRDHLPERSGLERCQAALAALETEAAPLREQRHEVARAQQALEDEIASVGAKVDEVNATLYGGGVTNPRELQSLQQDIDSLGRRRSSLEDKVLEQMVEAEPLDEALAGVDDRRAALDAEAVGATASLAEVEAAIDGELSALAQRREPLVAGLDAGLVERYQKLRTRMRGVAVARFEHGTCQGCHLTLPGAEAEQVRREAREAGIATCPECDRLLVV